MRRCRVCLLDCDVRRLLAVPGAPTSQPCRLTFLLAPTLATGVKYASTHLLLRGDLSEVDGARSFCAERLMAASQKENPHSLARSSAFLVLNSSLVMSPVSRSSLLDLVSYGFS